MLQRLALAWSAWKVAAKRFGPVGGLVAAGIVVFGAAAIKRIARDRAPEVAEAMDQAA